jgi:hypothetical protein
MLLHHVRSRFKESLWRKQRDAHDWAMDLVVKPNGPSLRLKRRAVSLISLLRQALDERASDPSVVAKVKIKAKREGGARRPRPQCGAIAHLPICGQPGIHIVW